MNSDQVRPTNDSLTGLILRLYWIFGGHGVAAMLALYITLQKSFNSVLINCIYLLAVLSLIVTRYIDIKSFAGQTAEGEPATLKHWKRYSILVVAIYAVVWIAAQLAGRYLQ